MPGSCPLCGGDSCANLADTSTNSVRYDCTVFGRSVRLGSDIADCYDKSEKRRRENLVFEHVLRQPMCGDKYWRYFYEPSYQIKEDDHLWNVNLAETRYPDMFSDKVDRALLNLHRIYPEYSNKISRDRKLARALFADTETEEKELAFLEILSDLGYLKKIDESTYIISAEGWKHIEELLRHEQVIKQGFIAMRFSAETKAISEAFKKAISESGYKPIRIDEKEHNNQIVPEIMFEIDQSTFLVMDVTVPNYGAYYEAGYALGKGKQVIICCRKEEFDGKERPHFDIQQKSTIVWEKEEELVERLKKRIAATVKSGEHQ